MRKIILIQACLLFAFAGMGQELTIEDEVTRQPLARVQVGNKKAGISLQTNNLGRIGISPLQNVDSIFIFLSGYLQQVVTYDQLQQRKLKVLLKEDPISLEAVVVTASKWRQDKRQTPAKISVISQKDILLQNPQTAADLLGQGGEVFIQKSQYGGGSPMIRGFSTNRVLITVDGVRMNTAIFRSGNLQNVISLDPFSIEKTEVQFGPGSVMYGSDAIGGVMNFSTLSPVLSSTGHTFIKGNAQARWASASNEKTGHVDLNIGLKKWAFLTSASYFDFDHLKMGSHGPEEYLRPHYVQTVNGVDEMVTNPNPEKQVPTGYNQYNLLQKVRFAANEHWDVQYGFQYSKTSDYSRYDRLLRYRGSNLRSAEWYYGPQEWMMNNLTVTSTARTALYDQMKIGAAQQYFRESRHDRDFQKTTRYNRIEKVNAWSFNIDLEKTLAQKHTLGYGIEFIYNKVTSTGTDEDVSTGKSVAGAPRYPDGDDWKSYAAYLTYRYKASEKLSLQAGTRYNRYVLNAVFDTSFYHFPFSTAKVNAGGLTGSAGLVYNPSNTWQLSANLSTGFRSPNVDDMGKIFESTPGSVVVPNPSLKSEYAYNIDAGIAKTFGGIVKVEISGFYTWLENALVRRNSTLNGQDSIVYDGELSQVQSIQNAAQARVWGVSGNIEIKLPSGFGISSRLNYQKGEEELDDGSTAPLRHAAPFFGITHLTYSRNRFKADFYAVYNSQVSNANLAPEEQGKDYMYAVDADGKPYSPSWATFNLKAMYQLTDNFMFTAALENITDRRYRPYSSGIVSPGRNFIISARVSF
ncbi:TonB-dependent receptor plug domain-containing protein [Foetidibacter luteolus]|uniref:TonB-dependent receptor plug domain-containing protein n=1 Tax=Foetidibacter luteolus TaxID=2608880 RepID=UPI00129A9B22|nr:TonB-dependent receptor [Foetidibacter luteolus]